MAGYYDSIDPQTLQAAQDWYIRRLKANMGVGSQDGLANPDGSTDNYRGYKPDVELAMTQNLDANGMVSGQQSSYDANEDLEAYRKDPAAWEKKAREGVKSWTVGREDNQQYVFDPKTGKFINQWHKDTSDRKHIQNAAIAAAAMYGMHGLGEYITAAEMASAGADAVGGNVVESVLGGAGEAAATTAADAAATTAADAAATTAADAAAKTAAEQEVARLAAKSAAKIGLGNISAYSMIPEVSSVLPAWVQDLGAKVMEGANVVGKFAVDNPTLTMFGLNTFAGAYNAQKNREQNDANNQASKERQQAADDAAAQRQKAADDAALERTKLNNQAQLDQQNNADRIKQDGQKRYNDSFAGLRATNGISRGPQKRLTRVDGTTVFNR